MKNLIAFCVVALLVCGCEPEFEKVELKDIKRLEPQDIGIVTNNVKVAHIICYEPARCEQNNDTLVSAYFDERGRLVELWLRFNNYGELYEYVDSTNWISKRIITDVGRKVYDIHYEVKPEFNLVTRYVLEGEDSVAEYDYRYNDKGLVTQFGPDEDNKITYYQYDVNDLMVKRTVQYRDSTYYWETFGRDEINTAYKIVEDYYYYEGRLDSSVRLFLDPYGNKFNNPAIFKYRYDGLLESEDGKFKFKFSYGMY